MVWNRAVLKNLSCISNSNSVWGKCSCYKCQDEVLWPLRKSSSDTWTTNWRLTEPGDTSALNIHPTCERPPTAAVSGETRGAKGPFGQFPPGPDWIHSRQPTESSWWRRRSPPPASWLTMASFSRWKWSCLCSTFITTQYVGNKKRNTRQVRWDDRSAAILDSTRGPRSWGDPSNRRPGMRKVWPTRRQVGLTLMDSRHWKTSLD